jgi:hypothetical protein
MAAVTEHIDDFDDPPIDHGDLEDLRGGRPDLPTTPIPHHLPQTFSNYAALEASVRAHQEAHGYEIARSTSSKNKYGEYNVRWICCAKGTRRQL